MKENGILPQRLSSSESLFINLIEAFHRLFKVGVYYPNGHVVLDQAVSRFLLMLRSTYATRSAITIEASGRQVIVEKKVLPEKTSAVQELFRFFTSLGIRSVTIDKAVGHQQLLQFVRSILNWQTQLESTKSFIKFNVSDLPDTIKVAQEEFLVEAGEHHFLHGEEGEGNTIEGVCRALAERGLTDEQVQRSRQLLHELSLSAKGKETDIQHLPPATWNDIQNLLYTIETSQPTSNGKPTRTKSNDINMLAAIFQNLGSDGVEKAVKQPINILLSHLSKSTQAEHEYNVEDEEDEDYDLEELNAEPPVTVRSAPKETGHEVTVIDLKQFVAENKIPIKILANLATTDHSEILSILLLILASSENQRFMGLCEQYLSSLIIKPLTSRELAVLIAGLEHCVANDNLNRFDKIFTLIVLALRTSQNLSSHDLIIELWMKLPATQHALLWPYAVNELLAVGMGEKKETFTRMTEVVSQMYPERMKGLRSRLEKLDVFRIRKVAPIFFRAALTHSYPLFSFLLSTSLGSVLSRRIIEELQKDPQDDFMRTVAPVLKFSDQNHLRVLSQYLALAQNPPLPLSLRKAAGRLLLNYLENISEEQCEAVWLPTTIRGLADLQAEGTDVMLDRIMNEKKYGVLPSWNRECRKAAEEAYQQMTSRPMARR